MNYQEAIHVLQHYGQLHVLQYYDQLSIKEQSELLTQIENTDFRLLDSITAKEEVKKGKIEPIQVIQLPEIEHYRAEYERIGIEAIKAGKVAAVLLAGGMGSRLGAEIPKGMFDIGVTKPLYIFEQIIHNLMEVVQKTNTWIPLYIMTSVINHDMTVAFFRDHDNFGYSSKYLTFFVQEMSITTDFNGKVYMESPYKMSTSPNGNGGWFSSMSSSGLLDRIHDMGIEWFNIFAVDNVLQRIADPCFIGATISGDYTVGSKVIKKISPEEKVGVICLEDGRPSIIEYYEMSEELLEEKDVHGEYAYNYGVILNYLFQCSELERISSEAMPIHLVERKIPYLNEEKQLIKPQEPNGYKYEILVLDMIHLMDRCLAYEVIRNKEFAPIKNKVGQDSVDSARALLVENDVVL